MSNLRKIQNFPVTQIVDHTDNVRELYISTKDSGFEFRAGQFVMLHVPEPEGKPALRAYSVASAEQNKDEFRLLFKYVDTGKASTYVWALKGQETLQFTGPFGRVFFQEPPREQIIFLNTGTGVSQHLCYLLSKKEQYPNLKYKMLFGVRTQKDIYAEDVLRKLKNDLPNFEYEFVLSRPDPEWKGLTGYVQNHLNRFEYKNTPTTFYLCGNGGMIKETKHQLIEVDGLDPKKVWSEAFD